MGASNNGKSPKFMEPIFTMFLYLKDGKVTDFKDMVSAQ